MQTKLLKDTMKSISETAIENVNSLEFGERLSILSVLLPELTNEQSDAQQRDGLFTAFIDSNPLRVLRKLSLCRTAPSDSARNRKVTLLYRDFIQKILNLSAQRVEMRNYLIKNQGFAFCLMELIILHSSNESLDSCQLLNNVSSYLLMIFFNMAIDEQNCLIIRNKISAGLLLFMSSFLAIMYFYFY